MGNVLEKEDLYKYRNFIETITNPWFSKVIEVQHSIHLETHNLWNSKGFKCINLPLTTGSISSPMGLGSDSSPVKIDLMGSETYLADSMQFALELGCRITKAGCYYIMPSFRGEMPDSTHLSQFFHSELEIEGGLDDVMSCVEEYIYSLTKRISSDLSDSLSMFVKDFSHIEQVLDCKASFPRITLDEAKKILKGDDYIRNIPKIGSILTRKGELALIDYFKSPVWLTHFDHLTVPFYQAVDKSDPTKALAADLLMGPGEVVGCGERHRDVEEVLSSLRMHRVSRDSYEWYCQIRESFPLKTSGFGMGIERFLMWIFKHDDIRDFEILPRANGIDLIP